MAIPNPEETLDFHNVSDFIGEEFLIPDYQRGYRWETQQVTDLLNDISFFYKEFPGESYSMQPIVVKRKNGKWEVVDGQQRLVLARKKLTPKRVNFFRAKTIMSK